LNSKSQCILNDIKLHSFLQNISLINTEFAVYHCTWWNFNYSLKMLSPSYRPQYVLLHQLHASYTLHALHTMIHFLHAMIHFSQVTIRFLQAKTRFMHAALCFLHTMIRLSQTTLRFLHDMYETLIKLYDMLWLRYLSQTLILARFFGVVVRIGVCSKTCCRLWVSLCKWMQNTSNTIYSWPLTWYCLISELQKQNFKFSEN
jgi:hypothetical protein